MAEPVVIGRATLYLGDCRDVLPTLPKVDAVVTDPPYFKVVGDYWDNEWDKPDQFLAWMRNIVGALNDRLPPHGSLYLFASPQMAARVEVITREMMNVLAMITWNKGARRKGAAGSGVDVTSLRTFWQAASERIIFAEPRSSEYEEALREAKQQIFGAYIAAAIEDAEVSKQEIQALFPSATGRITGCLSNWLLGHNCPTKGQYEAIRDHLNRDGSNHLTTPYELLAERAAARQAEIDEIRRPFRLHDKIQWGDVWDFDPPLPTPGKHPCEKPLPLLEHIIQVSTKPGQTVLDAFTGSGATGEAAVKMGRKFVGIERDPHWFAVACKRIEDAQRQGLLFGDAA